MKCSETMYHGCPNLPQIGATYATFQKSGSCKYTWIWWYTCLGTSFLRSEFCIFKPYALIEIVLLKKLIVAQPLKRYSAFYGTQRFIVVFQEPALTNFMEQSPSWKAKSFPATQEVPSTQGNGRFIMPTGKIVNMTALARASSNCKQQTRPLVREDAPYEQTRNCLTVTKHYLEPQMGAWHQDRLTDWPSVVT
jgi:hypothetical protein